MKKRQHKLHQRGRLRGGLRAELLEVRCLLAGDVCFPEPTLAPASLLDSAPAVGQEATSESDSVSVSAGVVDAEMTIADWQKLPTTHTYMADGRDVPMVVHPTRVAIGVKDGGIASWSVLPEDVRVVRPVTDGVAVYESASLTSDQLSELAAEATGVTMVAPVFVIQETGSEAVLLDEIIVSLRPGVDADAFFGENDAYAGFRPLRGTTDQYVVTLADATGEGALREANRLAGDRAVTWTSPNFYQNWQRFYQPNDPRWGNLWHLENTGQGGGLVDADQDLPEAWDVIQGGSLDITVGVFDDGVAIDHPDLNNWVNAAEAAGTPFEDDDGNGWLNDLNGWNFVSDNAQSFPTTASDNHGTAVAGVAAAIGDNAIGVTGASYGSPVIAGRLFENGSATNDANITEGLYYMAGRTADGLGEWDAADVVNNSWGGGGASTAMSTALTWATSTARGGVGVPFLFSAGNGGFDELSYPAFYTTTIPGVISVGSHSNFGARSGYSQYGANLDIVTASNGGSLAIDTTDRIGDDGYATGAEGDYTGTGGTGFGGTSSAAPLATGITALLLAEASNQGITLTAPEVRELLRANTDLMTGAGYDTVTGKNYELGFGALNAASLVSNVGAAEISVVAASQDLVDGSGTIDFGDVPTGDFAEIMVRVRNQGTETLDLSSVGLVTGDVFTITSGPGDTSLALGEATTFTLRFSPTTPGENTDTLLIASNDADEATFEVNLTGLATITSIGGVVFEDADASGTKEANEAFLPNALAYIDANDNDVFDFSVDTFSSTDTPVDINDLATATSDITVSGITSDVFDVNVSLDITHTYVSDLTVNLLGPDGTSIRLFTEIGGGAENFVGTVLDDQAAGFIGDSGAPFTGTFRPEEPLSAFNGLDPNGVWTLEVTDNYNLDTGTIDGWSLEISSGEESIRTNSEGFYGFQNLAVGDYTIRVANEAGYTGVTPGSGEYAVTLSDPADSFLDNDFGMGVNNRFYAHVFNDLNGDGVVDAGEGPLEGRSVFIDANGDEIFQQGNDYSFTETPGLNIPDPGATNDPVLSELVVSGVSGVVGDLDVRVNIDHAWNGDLDVFLISPLGTRVELFTGVGGSSQNFTDTVLDDSAASSITEGSAPFTGTYRPEGVLASFNGEDPNGTWVLEITDTYPSLDDGVLNEWEIMITTQGEVGGVTDAEGDVAIDLPAGTNDLFLLGTEGWIYTSPADGIHSETTNDTPLVGRTFGTRAAEIVAVVDVAVNGGDEQRSMTTELTVTFDGEVNIAAGAFTVEDLQTGDTAEVAFTTEIVGGATVATLTFVGGTAKESVSSSLKDGNYLLTIDSTLVTSLTGDQLDGDGDGGAGGNHLFGDVEADNFFRFFGDADGSRFIDFSDLVQILAAYDVSSSSSAYDPNFDFNENDYIGFEDLVQVLTRYETGLNY